jgi:tetratricopeptide (TPR) repeat protein
VPVWHEATAKWVSEGRLSLLGVTQEQHADRGQLFAQWKQIDWPILNDPINVLESKAVPIFVAIDEHGIVRQVGPKLDGFEKGFLDKQFDDDAPSLSTAAGKPDIAQLQTDAAARGTASAWMQYGDALALWGGESRVSDAIRAYDHAVGIEPNNGLAHFRLGVCYRRRFESPNRRAGDFQAAVDAWARALQRDPNQYIWRRRIQQYGPRLDKPYSFYDWVTQADRDIKARGERPIELAVIPQAAELAAPIRAFAEDTASDTSPDPEGRVSRDSTRLIEIDLTVVPSRVAPGSSAQIHMQFRPKNAKVHWNNESEPLRMWVNAPEGWQLSRRALSAPVGEGPESREIRSLDFEAKPPPTTPNGKARLHAHALYYVCEDAGGQCLFLRKDIEIPIEVGN